MTRRTDSLYPQDYDRWPRSVQRQYWDELHALYFPEQHDSQQAAPTDAEPGNDDTPETRHTTPENQDSSMDPGAS